MDCRKRWMRSTELKRFASTMVAYYRDIADEQETTVTFAPSLISYASGVTPYPNYRNTVRRVSDTMALAEVASALLKKSLTAKGTSMLTPLVDAIVGAVKAKEPDEQVRELQATIAATADTISGCLAAGAVSEKGEEVLAAVSPGLPAALKNLIEEQKKTGLTLARLKQTASLAALRNDNSQ